MNTKDITPTQYAEWRGCSIQNVTKCIRNNRIDLLPHVIKIKEWSRFYTLEVPEWLNAEGFKEVKFKRGRKSKI